MKTVMGDLPLPGRPVDVPDPDCDEHVALLNEAFK